MTSDCADTLSICETELPPRNVFLAADAIAPLYLADIIDAYDERRPISVTLLEMGSAYIRSHARKERYFGRRADIARFVGCTRQDTKKLIIQKTHAASRGDVSIKTIPMHDLAQDVKIISFIYTTVYLRHLLYVKMDIEREGICIWHDIAPPTSLGHRYAFAPNR
jgi:hypothetical protein